MEVDRHLRVFLHSLCELHFDISGFIDIEKELYAYKNGSKFCFCDCTRYGLDRKENGIKDDIVMLCEADDCGIHVVEDREIIANKRSYYIIDKSNNVIFERKDNFYDISGTFLRINSDSVIFLEKEITEKHTFDEIDYPCIKSLMPRRDSQKSVVVLNGVIQPNYYFLLNYKEYYFFSVDGKCKIYHAENGIIRECELGIIWFLSHEEAYLIEVITNDENVNEGNVVISSIEGNIIINYSVNQKETWKFGQSACSGSHMVLESLGNWIILRKKPHNFSATIKNIDNHSCNYYSLLLSNDTFILDDTLHNHYIYDLDGDYIGEHLKNATTHYCLYPKTIDSRTYYGVLRTDDYTIIIPPIYEKMDCLLYRNDSLFKVVMRDTLNNKDIEGILSAEYGLVVPFGCKYNFATYNNRYYLTSFNKIPFKITSDSYLIYEQGGYKGLVYNGKNVLGAEYDDIFGFDYSFDLGELENEDYLTLGITAQWAPNCVILKKGNHYGLFIDERTIILPIYESLDFVKCSNSVYYFIAEMKGMLYLINTLDGVLLSVPSDYSYVSSDQNKYTEIYVFKSKETEKYLFVDYMGNLLTYNYKMDKLINVQWHSKQFGFDVEKEGFICQERRTSDYDDGGYNQDELNDMYKDAFDNNPEYESNID